MSARTAAPEQVVFGDALIEPEIYRRARRSLRRRPIIAASKAVVDVISEADRPTVRSKLRQADQSVGLQYIENFAIDHIQFFWQILLIWRLLAAQISCVPYGRCGRN